MDGIPRADIEELIGLTPAFNYAMRALGMILMGAGLYRLGFMNGGMSTRVYRTVAIAGIGSGLSLAALGVVLVAANDFSKEVAFIGNIPNNLGTIPATLGYMSLIILWNQGSDNWLKRRLRAVGRMALTNYLAQSILGVLVLSVVLSDVTVDRAGSCSSSLPCGPCRCGGRRPGSTGTALAPPSGYGALRPTAEPSRCAAPNDVISRQDVALQLLRSSTGWDGR